ncbi:hypothetical protein [Sinomicrobium sp.]
MKKILVIFIAIFSVSHAFGQSSVDGYKYVIVPKKFDFLRSEDQYQVNALTKFLFEKYNFTAVYADEMSAEIQSNTCLGLRADVKNESNLFTTKLKVELTNCRGELVFASEIGSSKEKDYKGAYHEALRKAFKSIEMLNYSYDASKSIVASQNPVVSVPAKATNPEPVAEHKTPPSSAPAVQQAAKATGEVLYAQPIEYGYQLVDQTPKIVFVLQNTSVENVFIIKDKNGMLTLKDGKWIAEYYENGERVLQELEIRF